MSPSKALVVFDRAQFLGPTRELAQSLALDDVTVSTCDEDLSAQDAGGLPRPTATVKALDCWMRRFVETQGIRWEDTVALASAEDAVLLGGWVHDFAPRLRAMILVAPAFRDASYDALWKYTARRLVTDAAAIRIPTLLLSAPTSDTANVRAQRQFFDRLGTPLKRIAGRVSNLPVPLFAELRCFLRDAFDRFAAPPPLLDADRYGYTGDEYDRLITPLPWLSRRGAYYRLTSAGIRALSLLSPGIRLGWRTGFDSGQMLDYAYENRAHGIPVLTRWIERIFLANVGWRAVRRRKQHMEKVLREAIQTILATGQPARLLDVAAGPGRYVLEAIRATSGAKISALLRDNTQANLDDGRKLADTLGLKDVTFEWGDAFDERSLAAVQPSPNLAIACGLYELFGDNRQVLCSLRGLAAGLQTGGYLIYTNQPWHPNLEMLARTLTNRDGAPLVMRRRTQEEMDDLVRAVGFEKIGMEIDEFGVFTVSLARLTTCPPSS